MARQQEQLPPPTELVVSPPEDGAGDTSDLEIDPYVLALPCQRPHTLSEASTLPIDSSPRSLPRSPPQSPSLLDQEEQDVFEQEEEEEQSEVDG